MDVDAVGFLRTHSVVEVRDLDLEISGDAAKLYDKFAQELREQYGEILEVTKSVGELFGCLKRGDFELRDLCFRDDLYKLKKLEPLEGTIERENVKESAADDNGAANKVLLISNWSLAISDFVSRFAVSLSSAKLFDQVITQFQNLQEYGQWQEYETVIRDKCEQFVQYLLDSSSNNITFTVGQWARIWSLVFKGTNFPWNGEQVLKLDEILFQSLFQESLDVLMNDTDEEVSKFVHSSEFEQKLNAKILQDIERQFQLLEDLVSQQEEDTTPTFEYPRAVQELDVAQVVENCRLHSIGLTTRSRVQMYNLVDPLIQMINDLQVHGGQSDQVTQLRRKLATVLKNKIPVTDEHKEPNESLTMDQVLEHLMTNQNDSSASRLIRKQINALGA
ncbi:hypothetical protein ZYGR_0P03610 [Zygosaccharomyces rouxii]|uniref:ZYRO0E08822p n=2 Tax=Zygosaccharomyces rouxii TaxID=4956 RepID=C5E4U4_ZYGRC|nr:uncharacterized protein ZYRO0E08822g [Zygosaccharomyces rouxii]KAH9198089.1 hypothetical protein LQ764DRAFT_146582 [Zygosaccharomyces rouxii]GAV49715.1 hypothetical protein ZYGR_0P03610 [Zygosaccharomyces rouxii]CAR31055.1 ZYRO0E08822p [Zygosaccharomyces rouxii]